MRNWIAGMLLMVAGTCFAQYASDANIARRCMTLAKQNAGIASSEMVVIRDTHVPGAQATAYNPVFKAQQQQPLPLQFADAQLALAGPEEPPADVLLMQSQQLEMQADTAWSSGNYLAAQQQYHQAELSYEATRKQYNVAKRHYEAAVWGYKEALK
jgi:hypothetical protein